MSRPGVAYLILAHADPSHLERLITALDEPNAGFFVHVDGKSDITPFAPLFDRPRVTFMGERDKVFWGGFSQVNATLRLLRKATGEGYERYSLLSGSDFPIKGKQAIRDKLLGSDVEFLRVLRRVGVPPRNDPMYLKPFVTAVDVERYHLNDWRAFNPRVARRHRERRGTFWLWNGAQTAAHAVSRLAFCAVTAALPKRRYVNGMIPYQGSQWWSLSKRCVEYVFDFLARTPEYVRFHKTVGIPDEVFFTSIVKASPFAEKISHDFEVAPVGDYESGAHYIDWSAKGVPLPKTLDETDYPALVASPALFARKFDRGKSARLVELLEDDFRR